MSLTAIALVDSKMGIAKDGQQPIFIPEDLKRFKQITEGHAVVYGRKTLSAIGGLLPNRKNFVLSRNLREEHYEKEADRKNALIFVCRDINTLIYEISSYDDDIYVIGGEEVYRQLFPYCSSILLTEVDRDFNCNQFFPRILQDEWHRAYETPWHDSYGIKYRNICYERNV